jgi:predicted HicB family RNase H-like nuclease
MKPHYQKLVYWSDEDRCFIGRCPALFLGGVHGRDESKVFKELCRLVDEHIDELTVSKEALPPADADEYSGKITIRINPDLHRALAIHAMAEGDSLNHTIQRRLADSL